MIDYFKKQLSKLPGVRFKQGLSISYDGTKIDDVSYNKSSSLPVSKFSAKYRLSQENIVNGFELITIIKSRRGESLYELRSIKTGEIIRVDQNGFNMLFEKIKVKK